MRDMQIPEENIFVDYPTKEKRNKQQYNKLVKQLKENDLLYISNFSALGDGYKEVEEQWKFLTKTKNVDVVLIDMPLIDTRKGKSAYGPLIADTVLSMLEYVALIKQSPKDETEGRNSSCQRTRNLIW